MCVLSRSPGILEGSLSCVCQGALGGSVSCVFSVGALESSRVPFHVCAKEPSEVPFHACAKEPSVGALESWVVQQEEHRSHQSMYHPHQSHFTPLLSPEPGAAWRHTYLH